MNRRFVPLFARIVLVALSAGALAHGWGYILGIQTLELAGAALVGGAYLAGLLDMLVPRSHRAPRAPLWLSLIIGPVLATLPILLFTAAGWFRFVKHGVVDGFDDPRAFVTLRYVLAQVSGLVVSTVLAGWWFGRSIMPDHRYEDPEEKRREHEERFKDARAADPAGLELSPARYRRLRGWSGIPWLVFAWMSDRHPIDELRNQLETGDTRAAIVVSCSPLLVAAYTDELDCVVMLRFPDRLIRDHELRPGARLLAVVFYAVDDEEEEYAEDLEPGPGNTGAWHNAVPVIAEFLSDGVERIEIRKREIAEEEWRRCGELAAAYVDRWGTRARNGVPPWQEIPSKPEGEAA